LNVVAISLPPLRERRDDIVPLAEYFLHADARQHAPRTLTVAAAARLREHSWPGNVRELRNTIERSCVLVRGTVIDAGDLDIATPDNRHLQPQISADRDLPAAVAALESEMIRKTLAACGGSRAETARRLNIHRQLLYTKMQRYGLIEVSGKPTPPVGKPDH
jgi:DNA-binding NtrC family response regulator